MKQPTIAGIGELLWDVLDDVETLGGAPLNFAFHIQALGASGIPISTVGIDDRGQRALEKLKKHGICTDAIGLDSIHPTGYVNVHVDVWPASGLIVALTAFVSTPSIFIFMINSCVIIPP